MHVINSLGPAILVKLSAIEEKKRKNDRANEEKRKFHILYIIYFSLLIYNIY